jgi:hypothetical protein
MVKNKKVAGTKNFKEDYATVKLKLSPKAMREVIKIAMKHKMDQKPVDDNTTVRYGIPF